MGSINFHSPFADLAIALNLNWLALLLFADAFVSPSGAGITNTATTARMVYGMKENGHMPKVFGTIHPIYGVPRAALCLNLAVSFVFLFLFRGWGSLAEVISVATLISYATGPVAVMVLRQRSLVNRPIRVRGMGVIAPVAFILASLILYWATWPLTGKVVLIMVWVCRSTSTTSPRKAGPISAPVQGGIVADRIPRFYGPGFLFGQ